MKKTDKLTDFAAKAGISIGYASQIVAGQRTPTVEMALNIYRRTGRQFGILVGATPAEAKALVRCAERTGTIPAADEAVAA